MVSYTTNRLKSCGFHEHLEGTIRDSETYHAGQLQLQSLEGKDATVYQGIYEDAWTAVEEGWYVLTMMTNDKILG